MIKALSKTKDGKPIVVIGLSKMNIQKLKENKPIYADLKESLGIDVDLSIFYGKTEKHMERMFLKEMFNMNIGVGEIKRDKPLSLRDELIEAVRELIKDYDEKFELGDSPRVERVRKALKEISE